MNSLKIGLAALMNATATLIFFFSGKIHWAEALVLSVGSIAGGFVGAHAGSRIKPIYVKSFVIVIGLVLSYYFFLKTA